MLSDSESVSVKTFLPVTCLDFLVFAERVNFRVTAFGFSSSESLLISFSSGFLTGFLTGFFSFSLSESALESESDEVESEELDGELAELIIAFDLGVFAEIKVNCE